MEHSVKNVIPSRGLTLIPYGSVFFSFFNNGMICYNYFYLYLYNLQ